MDFSRNLDLELVVIQQHHAKVFWLFPSTDYQIQGVGCGFIIGISDRGYSLVGGVFHHVGGKPMKFQ